MNQPAIYLGVFSPKSLNESGFHSANGRCFTRSEIHLNNDRFVGVNDVSFDVAHCEVVVYTRSGCHTHDCRVVPGDDSKKIHTGGAATLCDDIPMKGTCCVVSSEQTRRKTYCVGSRIPTVSGASKYNPQRRVFLL